MDDVGRFQRSSPAVGDDPPPRERRPLATSVVGNDSSSDAERRGSDHGDDRPEETATTVPYCQESQDDRARSYRAYAELEARVREDVFSVERTQLARVQLIARLRRRVEGEEKKRQASVETHFDVSW